MQVLVLVLVFIKHNGKFKNYDIMTQTTNIITFFNGLKIVSHVNDKTNTSIYIWNVNNRKHYEEKQ